MQIFGTKQTRRLPVSRGTTLLELITIVSLIGILSAFAISTLQPYIQRYRLKGAAATLATELARIRQDAIRTRLCHYFVPNGTAGFKVVRDDASTPNCQFDATDPTIRTVNLAGDYPGVSFTSGSATLGPYGGAITSPTPSNLRFEPRGLVTGIGGASIYIDASTSIPMAVSVSVAGVVRTWSFDGGTWH